MKHPYVRDVTEEEKPGSVRDIQLYPDDKEALQSECESVDEVSDEILTLVDDLIRTMEEYQGIGIAAPQIGVQKRVAVVANPQGDPHVLINPEILDRNGKMTTEEGCLSIPGMQVEVERARKIRLTTLNREGEREEMVRAGHPAVVFQHEIDHLDGTLMFEHVSRMKRRMAMKEYKKLRKAATREDFDLLEARR